MNWKSHLLTFIVVFAAVVLMARSCQAPARTGGPPPDARYAMLTLEGRPDRLSALSYEVQVELADTQEKRWQGLAGRQGLPKGAGMLYVYDEPQRPQLSEAGTPFPLSVAFLRDDGTVTEIHDTAAGDPTVIQPAEPVRYVLEVRQGWFADRGAGPGSRFLIPELPAPPAPTPEAPEEAASS